MEKSRSQKIVRTIIAVTAVVLTVNFLPKIIDIYVLPNTEALLEKEWVTKTHGVAPSITISTPIQLVGQSDLDLPDEIKKSIISSSNYSYSNRRVSLEFTVSNNSYDLPIQTSLGSTISGAQRELLEEPDVTDFTSQITDFNIAGINDKRVTRTFKNRVSIVTLIYPENDVAVQNIIEKIENSIKIDLNYVE